VDSLYLLNSDEGGGSAALAALFGVQLEDVVRVLIKHLLME
jgi:hypothetical protein